MTFNYFNHMIWQMDNAIWEAKRLMLPCNKVGRGIVILGGKLYDPSSYVLISMIRHYGCQVPITLFHKGEDVVSDRVKDLGVKVVDLNKLHAKFPYRNTWEWKEVAIRSCGYKDVLYLDADTYPVQDLTMLFEDPIYKETGSLFWRDVIDSEGFFNPRLWGIESGEYFFTPQCGALLINSVTHTPALHVLRTLNERSDYWYTMSYSDQEQIRAIWTKMKLPYGCYSHDRVSKIAGDMVFIHKDRASKPLVVHLTGAKFGWTENYDNSIPEIQTAIGYYRQYSSPG